MEYTMVDCAISIHAPLRGRLFYHVAVRAFHFDFNPRPLAGATELAPEYFKTAKISIHAPLRGRQQLDEI